LVALGIIGVSAMRSLSQISILREIPTDALSALERRCRWHHCESGELIIGHSDASTEVYFLLEGRARVIIHSADGKAVAFRDLGPGDFFGEWAAIDGQPRSASIEALDRCTLASMTADIFWEVLIGHPTAAGGMLRHLVSQLRIMTSRVYEFSTLAVRHRIHNELLRLAHGGEQANGSAIISPAPKHTDIAIYIGTRREAVSRELSYLTQIGLIDRQAGRLVIRDVARLAQMAQGATNLQ
jgi:CRP/FNR family transcriptional regulator, cyclic AMP receptor protein